MFYLPHFRKNWIPKDSNFLSREGEMPGEKSISVSQQSYDLLYDHFSGLVKLVEAQETYNPNEKEFQFSSPIIKRQGYKQANKEVSDALTFHNNTAGISSAACTHQKRVW